MKRVSKHRVDNQGVNDKEYTNECIKLLKKKILNHGYWFSAQIDVSNDNDVSSQYINIISNTT